MKHGCVIIETGNRSRRVLDGIINRNRVRNACLYYQRSISSSCAQKATRGSVRNQNPPGRDQPRYIDIDIDGGQSNVSEREHNISPRKLQCVGYNVALSHPTPSGVTCNKRRDAVELET